MHFILPSSGITITGQLPVCCFLVVSATDQPAEGLDPRLLNCVLRTQLLFLPRRRRNYLDTGSSPAHWKPQYTRLKTLDSVMLWDE
jgi:hypothetical protein